jgi:hypothetical protein
MTSVFGVVMCAVCRRSATYGPQGAIRPFGYNGMQSGPQDASESASKPSKASGPTRTQYVVAGFHASRRSAGVIYATPSRGPRPIADDDGNGRGW